MKGKNDKKKFVVSAAKVAFGNFQSGTGCYFLAS